MSADSINNLKAKFVAGAIPLEEDYALLLNMLEDTRKATGTSPDTQSITGTGLALNDKAVLGVKAAPDGGLEVSSSGLQVKCKPGGGISADASGLKTDLELEAIWAYSLARSNNATFYGHNSYGAVFLIEKTKDQFTGICCFKPSVYLKVDSANQISVQAKSGIDMEYIHETHREAAVGFNDASNRNNAFNFAGTGDDIKSITIDLAQVSGGASNVFVITLTRM